MNKAFITYLASIILLVSCGLGNSQSADSTTKDEQVLNVIAPKSEGTRRILMVGNSHTEYFASFPRMLEALCKENGKDVEIISSLAMGVSLDENKKTNNDLLTKISTLTDPDGNYLDYIILQESTPVVYQEPIKYEVNAKMLRTLFVTNSPDVATYIYGLTFPEDVTSSDFKQCQQVLDENTLTVATALPNTGVLPFSKVLIAAYQGKEGYTAIKDGKDYLRYTDNSRHMLNDAVFVNSIVLYQILFGETPKIPEKLPLATGIGDSDQIQLMNINQGVSNPESLLKLATSFK